MWGLGLVMLALVSQCFDIALARCNVPVLTAGQDVTLAGRLQGGIMAIGSETTGWRLVYRTLRTQRSIEVDFSDVAGKPPVANTEVVVSGVIVERTYTERGVVFVLKAKTWRLGGASDADCRSSPHHGGPSR